MREKIKKSFFGHLKFAENDVEIPESGRQPSRLQSQSRSSKRSSERYEDNRKVGSRDIDNRRSKGSPMSHQRTTTLRGSTLDARDRRGGSWRDHDGRNSSAAQRGPAPGASPETSREADQQDYVSVDLDPRIKLTGKRISEFIPPELRKSTGPRPSIPPSPELRDSYVKSSSIDPSMRKSSLVSSLPRPFGSKSALSRSSISDFRLPSGQMYSGLPSPKSSFQNRRSTQSAWKPSINPTYKKGSGFKSSPRKSGKQPRPKPEDATIGRAQTDPLFLQHKMRPDLDYLYASFPWLETDDPIQTEWRTEHITVPWTQGKPFCCVQQCPTPCFVGPPLLANGGCAGAGLKWLRRRLLTKPPFYDVCGCASAQSCPHGCCERRHGPRFWRKMKPVTTWHLAGRKDMRPPPPLPPPTLATLATVDGGVVCNVSEAPPPPPGPQLPDAFACRRAQEAKPRKSPPSPTLDPSAKGTLWAPSLAALKMEEEPTHLHAHPWQRTPFINVVGAVADAGWQGHSECVAARDAVQHILRNVLTEGDDQKAPRVPCGMCGRAKRPPRNSLEKWRAIVRRHEPNYCCGVALEPSPSEIAAAAAADYRRESQDSVKARETAESADWIRENILGAAVSKAN